jgi:hypothetical protein
VDAKEGMFQGGTEQSEFIVTDDAFPWQDGRTLDEVYQNTRENYLRIFQI